jgi:putative membrane protein
MREHSHAARSASAKKVQPLSTGAEPASIAEDDIVFLERAAEAAHVEIAAARAARARSSGLEVRTLAAKMQRDHERSFGGLKALAAAKHVKLTPASHLTRVAEAEAMVGTLSGEALENAWIAMMIADHREAIGMFERAIGSEDPDISEFAERTLPSLRSHLLQLRDVEAHLQA